MPRTIICILLAIFGGLLATNGWAAPATNSVSGTMTHMQTVTISGSGFGTKPTAAPALWDTVDNIASYASLSDGATIPYGGSHPWGYNSYDSMKLETAAGEQRSSHSAKLYKGSSVKHNLGPNSMTSTGKLYVSWWWKPDSDPTMGGNPTYSAKFLRAGQAGIGGHNTFSWTQSQSIVYRSDEGYGAVAWHNWSGITNAWNFHEVWFDSAAQTYSISVNGVVLVANVYWGSITSFPFDEVQGIGWEGNADSASMTSWMDDIYVDNTFARVVIGNASTYDASTHREMQIPTAWAGSSVSVTVNTGSFTAGQQAYLYVVAPDGSVNSQGYPIVIEGGASASSPTSPTALLVR